MSWKYTDEYYREYTRKTWNETADAWVEWLEILKPFGDELLRHVRPKSGENALDIGTGSGEPAMTLAGLVSPAGRVTGIDLSERMIEIARETSRLHNLPNIAFKVMDAENLDFQEGSFDLAVSRFGFQIFTHPERAASEAFRVLKPGGRIGVTVWSTGDKVPALHAIVGAMLEHATPDETGYLPTPYELGGPRKMCSLLENAGFSDASETRITKTMRFRDEEEYLRFALKGTPLGHSVIEEEQAVQDQIIRKTVANLQKWKTGEGIALPAECVIVTARRRDSA